MRTLIVILIFLFISSSFAQDIKKITGPVKAGDKKMCTASEAAAGKCSLANGSGNAGQMGIPISSEELKKYSDNAKGLVQKSDQFTSSSNNSKLNKALRATVQIIPKCAIAVKGDTYVIDGVGGKSEFCPGHPLAGSRAPSAPEAGVKTLAGDQSNDLCSVHACSGALVGEQNTITTAAHCMAGKSAKDFCDQYVFVFNRTDTKTEFNKNEISECESGTKVDTSSQIQDFNTNSDYGSKDHAVFTLKEPVSTDVATALQLRKTELNSQEDLYASGHPRGTTRSVSKMKNPKKFDPNTKNYNYAFSEGYVQPGNSGGPLLDKNGQVVGIMSAVDDKPQGDDTKRDPLVRPEGTKLLCRAKAVSGPYRVEAITYGEEITKTLAEAASGQPKMDTVLPEEIIR